MRLYKSRRFAVYGQRGEGTMQIVKYGDRAPLMRLHQYYFVKNDDDKSMILGVLYEEQGDDIDALLAAYTAMEEPYDGETIQ